MFIRKIRVIYEILQLKFKYHKIIKSNLSLGIFKNLFNCEFDTIWYKNQCYSIVLYFLSPFKVIHIIQYMFTWKKNRNNHHYHNNHMWIILFIDI